MKHQIVPSTAEYEKCGFRKGRAYVSLLTFLIGATLLFSFMWVPSDTAQIENLIWPLSLLANVDRIWIVTVTMIFGVAAVVLGSAMLPKVKYPPSTIIR